MDQERVDGEGGESGAGPDGDELSGSDRPEDQRETEQRKERRGVSDGLKQGLGALSAVRDAIEEAIGEARERGDLSAERAKQAMKRALDRAGSAAGEARERFDFPLQKDFEALVARVEAIERQLGIASPPSGAADDDGVGAENAGDPVGNEG